MKPMFWSSYPLRLDDRHRFFVPKAFRAQLCEGMLIVQAPEHCLAIYTMDGANKKGKKFMDLPDTPENRASQRMFTRHAHFVAKPDSLGRVPIPQGLREWANLDRDIIVQGALDRIEIWNPQAFDAYDVAYGPGYANLGGVHTEPDVTGS